MSKNNIIGLDISDFSIEAVLLSVGKKQKVLAYSRYRLSPDIVSNGRILNKERLKEDLGKLFSLAKPKKLKVKKVFISVPESQVFSRILFLPKNVKNKDLIKIAQLKAEEYIPEKRENLIAALKILPASKNYKEVLYAALPREVIKDLAEVLESMDIEIEGATMESISSFAGLKDKQKKKITLLLDLGSRTTIASTFDKHGLRDTININIAGHKISTILMEKLDISHFSAREKKRSIGLRKLDDDGRIMMAIQGQFQPLLEEIKKFINFYEESNKQRVEQVILIGGTAQMPGIDEYFKENLDLETSLGQGFLEEKNIPKQVQSLKYINALGLARLAYQKKVDINFYQTSSKINWQKKYYLKDMFNLKRLLILISIILLTGFLYYFQKDFPSFFSLDQNKYRAQFLVGLEERSDLENYLKGLEVVLPLSLEKSYEDREYEEALELLSAAAAKEALAQKDSLKEEGYYLIPYIFTEEVISIVPAEDLFIINDNLALDINYKFIIFANEDFENLIFSKLPIKKGEKLKEEGLFKINYSLIEYKKEDKLFYLNGNLEIEREK